MDEAGYPKLSIEVDGNVTCERAQYFRTLGVDMFVAGTSSIFGGDLSSMQSNIDQLKNAIKTVK